MPPTMPTRPQRLIRLATLMLGAVGLLLTGCTAPGETAPSPTPAASSSAPDSDVDVTPEELTAEAADILEENGLYSGGDWSAQKEVLLEAGRTAADLDEAREAIRDAASDAGGPHTSYLYPSEREAAYSEAPGAPPTVEATKTNTVTITLPAIGQGGDAASEYAEAGAGGLVELASPETCGFIVDLRGNFGGNMFPMLGAVSPLFDVEHVASFVDRNGVSEPIRVTAGEVRADGETLSFAAPATETDAAHFDKPVAILQDTETASAAEMVITAFGGQENARTFGMTSVGLATSNGGWVLSDGSELILTYANYADRSGSVMPLRIAADEGTLSDDADEAAHAWLAEKCQG